MQQNQKDSSEQHRHQRGMSIIEVMLGLAVFLLGSTAVFDMQLYTAQQNARTWNRALGANLASGMLEELQVADFNAVLGSQTTYYRRTGELATGVSDPLKYYEVTWTAYPTGTQLWTDIEVEVRWVLLFLGGVTNAQPNQSLKVYGRIYHQ